MAAEARRHAWVTPSGEDGFGDGGDAGRRRYVMMSDQRRREWGLPDVANGRSTTHRSSAAADGGAPTPPVTATRHPVVANEVRRRVSRFDQIETTGNKTRALGRRTPEGPADRGPVQGRPAETMSAQLANLPEGVSVARGRIEVRFDGAEDALARLYALALVCLPLARMGLGMAHPSGASS